MIRFAISLVGVVVCIAGMFFARAWGLPAYMLSFAGNAMLCAIGAWAFWYMDRLTNKSRGSKKGP